MVAARARARDATTQRDARARTSLSRTIHTTLVIPQLDCSYHERPRQC